MTVKPYKQRYAEQDSRRTTPFHDHLHFSDQEIAELRLELAKADETIAQLRAERNFLQRVATRRSDRLEAAGLHSDCTQDGALAVGKMVRQK